VRFVGESALSAKLSALPVELYNAPDSGGSSGIGGGGWNADVDETEAGIATAVDGNSKWRYNHGWSGRQASCVNFIGKSSQLCRQVRSTL